MFRRTFIGAAATMAALPLSALAQDAWPNKPVKIIMPFPAGGTSDVMARMVAEPLTKELGQQVIVENIGGAGGTIGTLRAPKMPPDGYTIVQTGVGQNAVAHGLDPKLGYDSMKDFIHIAQVHTGPNLLVVHPSTPFKTFKELVDYVRKNPGKLNYGFTHAASGHMAMELLKQRASECPKGVKECNGFFMVGIPYRGGGPMLQDLLGGQIPMMFINQDVALQHVRAGKLRALACTSLQRNPLYPDVPTIARERLSGLPGADVVGHVAAQGHAAADRRQVRGRDEQDHDLGRDQAASSSRWASSCRRRARRPTRRSSRARSICGPRSSRQPASSRSEGSRMNTRAIQANPLAAGLAAGEATTDRIEWIKLSLVFLPLETPISDAKVLTGRQKPLTEIAFLFAEIETQGRPQGVGFSYTKRAGGPGQYRAREGDRAEPDRRGSQRHRAAVGQAGVGRRVGRPQRPVDAGDRRLRHRAVGPEGQARQACRWPSCSARTATRCSATTPRAASCRSPIDEVLRNVESLARTRHRRHQDQGRPARPDGRPAARAGGAQADRRPRHLMVDANQQWDRADRAALRPRWSSRST